MKSTEPLAVKHNLIQKDDIIIHPNEGFDLGIMNTKCSVKIFANTTIEIFNTADKDFTEGVLCLENKCSHGTIMLNTKFWKKIGSPEKVRIFFENNKILLTNS